VDGGAGRDTISGGTEEDELSGGAGKDTIVGGADPDLLSGGSGGDTINARDGGRDTINCGSGNDLARVDRFDVVRRCEQVSRR
jgi:Ca2+-binding RTX toxin-like protein